MITSEPQPKPNSQSSIIALYPAAFAMVAAANSRSGLALRHRKLGRLNVPDTRPAPTVKGIRQPSTATQQVKPS